LERGKETLNDNDTEKINEKIEKYGIPGDGKKPPWLRVRVRNDAAFMETEALLRELSLNTVCEEATCPNRIECFAGHTATFMILGDVCTRNCAFCDVTSGAVLPPDPTEPERIGLAVKKLGLRHSVITSVTRDDLPDGGAAHFAKVISAIRKKSPETVVEVLIPDFQGDAHALQTVIEAAPDIINHNVETIPELYSAVRPQADYRRSLQLLQAVKNKKPDLYTKSGIMLGLGEELEQVEGVLHDLRDVGCDFITIGQYLAPSKEHYPVAVYVFPEIFDLLEERGVNLGFSAVASAPLVRSSYRAAEFLEK
jgi:lipoyl synthase